MENPNGRGGGGLTIMEFRGHGGVMHFGISDGKGGLKYGSRSSEGTDIFWNRPFLVGYKNSQFISITLMV